MKRPLLLLILLSGCAGREPGPTCAEWPGVTYRYVGAGVQALCDKPYGVDACARLNPDGTYTVIMPRAVTGPGDALCSLMDHENRHTRGVAYEHVPPQRLGPGGWEH